MQNNEIILTQEGYDKLLDELKWREGERNSEIVERIKVARDFGDLSENSEYDDAKEEQAKNASRINELRAILATAKISQSKGSGKNLTASIGSTIEVEDERGDNIVFKIVGTTETNSLEHKISNESPMGSALLGHKAGEEIEYVTPSGKTRKFVIKNVSR